jgi:molybdate transport system substrate-binding protein
MRRRWWAAAFLLLAACSGTSDADEDGSGDRTLRVLAAASLTEAFTELEQVYENTRACFEVQVSYDSSAVLAQQVLEGAPADVLATADEATMARVADDGLADPQPFVTNTLTLVTPPDDPGGIAGIADLDSDDVSYAVCVPEAPCGQAAERLLALNGVSAAPATEQQDVKSVLTQVTSGQVDAGLVYVTDAKAAGDEVRTVRLDNATQVVNTYPIAALSESSEPDAARAWVELVTSARGQRVLASYGFGPPAP